MTQALLRFLRDETGREVHEGVRRVAAELSRERGARAVLFYGSNLRTGDVSGVLDVYVLTAAPPARGVGAWLERRLWPAVSFRTISAGGRRLRVKAATMSLETFRTAAEGRLRDTTVWTRFVQPCAIVWTADAGASAEVLAALAAACVTAARFAAALGARAAPAAAFWTTLFRETYAAEIRIERPGRERQIVAAWEDRYEALLPLAWAAGGVAFRTEGRNLEPRLEAAERERWRRLWRERKRWGKLLNLARLVKAALTVKDVSGYAAWKIERHTGEAIALSPWRERHPLLAAPGVWWRLRRGRQAERKREVLRTPRERPTSAKTDSTSSICSEE